VGEKQLATSVATESALSAKHVDKRQYDSTDKLWGDGIVLRSCDLVSSTPLATVWTMDIHSCRSFDAERISSPTAG